MDKLRIIVVDDHFVVREGTRKMLEQNSDLEVIAEAESGNEAVSLTKKHKPDILLLDVGLPDISGIEALKKVKKDNPKQIVVMFSAYDDLQYVNAAVKKGADGYLTKNISSKELYHHLKCVMKGEKVFSQDISSRLLNQMWSTKSEKSELTTREYEILTLVAKGNSNQEISEELCIAVRTVETHVGNILKKLGVTNRTQLSSYAYEKGMI